LIYFSGNKETLDINQFLKDPLVRDLFLWRLLEIHIKSLIPKHIYFLPK